MEKKHIESKKMNLTDPVPERGSLALLALGAAGIRAWREKRKAQTSKK